MKKYLMTLTAVVLLISAVLFVGCAPSKEKAEQQSKDVGELSYAFELPDVDGNMHKLSDYQGKPVYLEIWASWCSVCITGLPDLDALAAEAQEFYILSVLTPSHAGEKSKDKVIAWYKDLGYENLIVLIDEEKQIVRDFGVQAYPSNAFFDADGNFAGGLVGLMSEDLIAEEMAKIAQ